MQVREQDTEDFIFDHNGEDDFGANLPAVREPGREVARQDSGRNAEARPPVPATETRIPRDVVTYDDDEGDDRALVSEAIRDMMNPSRDRHEVAVRTPVETRPAPQDRQPPAPRTDQQDAPLTPREQAFLRDLQEERRLRQDLQKQIQPPARQPQAQTEQEFETRFFSNPREVLGEVVQSFAQQLAGVRLETDLSLTQMKHGEDKFKEAFDAYMAQVGDGGNLPLYQRVMNAESPGEEIIKWHRENRLVTETGGDLDAFRARLREEILAEMQGGGAPQPTGRQQAAQEAPRAPNGQFAPRHELRVPTATSRINGSPISGNEDLEDGSDDAIFDAGRAPRRTR